MTSASFHVTRYNEIPHITKILRVPDNFVALRFFSKSVEAFKNAESQHTLQNKYQISPILRQIIKTILEFLTKQTLNENEGLCI